MVVVLQERLKQQLSKWQSQPDQHLPDYEFIPLEVWWDNLKISNIDGLFWKSTKRTANVEYIAARIWQGDLEQQWIISSTLMDSIPGGRTEVVRLNSVLTELGVEKLKAMVVKLKEHSGEIFVGITVPKIAERSSC